MDGSKIRVGIQFPMFWFCTNVIQRTNERTKECAMWWSVQKQPTKGWTSKSNSGRSGIFHLNFFCCENVCVCLLKYYDRVNGIISMKKEASQCIFSLCKRKRRGPCEWCKLNLSTFIDLLKYTRYKRKHARNMCALY